MRETFKHFPSYQVKNTSAHVNEINERYCPFLSTPSLSLSFYHLTYLRHYHYPLMTVPFQGDALRTIDRPPPSPLPPRLLYSRGR